MNVRRYRARDMREAMRQVREYQGPDAVILSTHRVDGMLEVVAAFDSELVEQEGAAPAKLGTTARSRDNLPPSDPDLEAMRRELSDLRHLLVAQNNSTEMAQWAARHPVAAELVSRLVHCGFNEKLARSLVGGITEDHHIETAWSRLRARLSAALTVTQPEVLERGGMLALVGPTGVGKTTTISRLALRQMRRMGREAVSLVTLDRQRFGAYKQLQAFGQMAGLSVMLMEDERELTTLTNHAGDGRLVLIDTAGRAARDMMERRLFATVRAETSLETWLVVAATHQARVMNQVLQAFEGCEPTALVLTKVDEAALLGEVLSVLLEQRLGLTFYSDGQRLTEDFHAIDTAHLTSLALREVVTQPQPRRWAGQTTAGMSGAAEQLAHNGYANHADSQAGMILESVVPFSKRPHVGF